MHDVEKVIEGLESLYKSMNGNQCYACSHEFVNHVEKFGTEILVDAIDLLKEQEERIKLLEHQLETITKWRANAGAFD